MHIIFEKNINVSSIKISPRSIIKCTNCPQYDKNPSCPLKAPDYNLAKKWLYSFSTKFLTLPKSHLASMVAMLFAEGNRSASNICLSFSFSPAFTFTTD